MVRPQSGWPHSQNKGLGPKKDHHPQGKALTKVGGQVHGLGTFSKFGTFPTSITSSWVPLLLRRNRVKVDQNPNKTLARKYSFQNPKSQIKEDISSANKKSLKGSHLGQVFSHFVQSNEASPPQLPLILRRKKSHKSHSHFPSSLTLSHRKKKHIHLLLIARPHDQFYLFIYLFFTFLYTKILDFFPFYLM